MSVIQLTTPGPGSWDPPDIYGDARPYLVQILVRAPGGGGEGFNGFSLGYPSGSGGGEAVALDDYEATPGVPIDYYNGLPGNGGDAQYDADFAGAAGTDGEPSWFGSPELCLARPGYGGNTASGAPDYSGYGGGQLGRPDSGPAIGDRSAPGGNLCGACELGCGGGQGAGRDVYGILVRGVGDQEWGGSKDSPVLQEGGIPNNNVDGGDGGLGDDPTYWSVRPAAAGDNPPSTLILDGEAPGGGGAGNFAGKGGNGGPGWIEISLPAAEGAQDLTGDPITIEQGSFRPAAAITLR